jgi:PAS domain S-box-containing protein
MEENAPKKFDWRSVTDDFEKMQQISGVAGGLGIIIAIIIALTAGLPYQNAINIWITIVAVLLFTSVYYLMPKLYLNKNLLFLPDIIFVLGISSMMYNAGSQGEVFVIFLIFLIAIDAFMFTSQLFYVVLWCIVISFLTVNYLRGSLDSISAARTMIFELYGILSVGIILRNFAEESLSLRKSREDLEKKTKVLRNQKHEIYMLIDNLSEGFVAVDMEKNITFINKAALKLLGIVGVPKKMVGKNIDDLLSVAGPEGIISIVEQALTKKEALIRDDLRLVKAERTVRIHSNTTPIIEDGALTGALVLFRDISTQKEIEEQRAEFNAIASHELRTPLTVIEGMLFYILNDKKLKYDKKTREYVSKTYASAESLLHLSNDILTVIKADENQIKLALEETDIKKIIEEVASEFKNKAKEKKDILTLKLPTVMPKVISDQQKIKEILTNLIENAIKFTDRGKIIVSASEIKDKELIISVQDNGVGIKKEDQRMVFHKFFRAEDWQTRKTGGTGLGLFIAKTFAERLGGNIWVESAPKKGSTFSFSIPLNLKRIHKKQGEEQLTEFIKSI